MTSTEKWNKICDYFDKFRTQPEERIQNLWEKFFAEIFGYSSLENEIDTHRTVQIGSTERMIPDIIIKNSESDLFIVELKKETLPIDTAHKNQLFSYLKQLRVDLGILVCDQIAIFDYNYNIDENQQIYALIHFKKDNPIGIKFVELFSKENFDRRKIKDFVNKCVDTKQNIANIKKELTNELVKKLITEYFLQSYTEDDVSIALKEYSFEVNEKRLAYNTTYVNNYPANDMLNNGSGKKKYYLDGKDYPKRRLVLEIVKRYTKSNPAITYEKLEAVFPKRLQGSLGVFDKVENIKTKVRSSADHKFKNRFFLEDPIYIDNGKTEIAVCGEWGDNFDRFLEVAINIGFNIESKLL